MTNDKLDGLAERVDRQAADQKWAITGIAGFRNELERRLLCIGDLVIEIDRWVM